jgi:uncharacterized OB-fold protein
MPKQSPIPNGIDAEFYRAANEERLVLQNCSACDRWQFPPAATCAKCGNSDSLAWRELDGRGTIYSFGVVYDTPVASLQPDQPYNVAVISLDEAPEINMLSHLPGSLVGQVPIGRAVRLVFESTPATGQKVPEWKLVK